MGNLGRVWRIAAVVVVGTVGPLLLSATAASAAADPAEAQFLAATNRVRAAHGLPALEWSPSLTGVARRWSSYLASAWRLAHNMNLPNDVPADAWVKLGENVGTGSTVPSIQGAFEASPTHFENILDPEWTRVGIGVVEVAGRIFVTLDFMRPAPANAAAAPAPAQRVVRLAGADAGPAPAPAPAESPAQISALVLGASLDQVRGVDQTAPALAPRQREQEQRQEVPATRSSSFTPRRIGLALLAWASLSAAAAFVLSPLLRRPPALDDLLRAPPLAVRPAQLGPPLPCPSRTYRFK